MKLANIKTVSGTHLAAETEHGVVDLTAAGCPLSLQDLICGADRSAALRLAADESLPVVEAPVFENVVNPIGKLLCVGFNYKSHTLATGFELYQGCTGGC